MDFVKLLNDASQPNYFPVYKQDGWKYEEDPSPLKLDYLAVALYFSIAVFLLEFYLDSRQLRNFRTILKVPNSLKGVVPQNKFQQSSAYGADKLAFGCFEGTFMFCEGIALVLLGWLPYAWDLAQAVCLRCGLVSDASTSLWREVMITFVFTLLLSMHDTLLSLPFSIYSTFVVEQKHGFNKTTYSLYFQDKAMGLGLQLLFGFPILGAIVWLIRLGGPHFYVYVWFFLMIVSVIMMMIYPTMIAPLFNQYIKLEEGPLYNAIEKLAKQVSFPLTEIYSVDGSRRSAHSNAYFYGFFKSKRIVLFDTLIKQVKRPELLAILGHEIGHWKLGHTIQGFVISQVYTFSLFLCFSLVQNTPALFSAFGFSVSASEPTPVCIGLVLFIQSTWTPVDKILTLCVNINSRANEFAADNYAKELGMGADLASGLIKISIENLGNLVPDSLYSLYHFSHPPLVERLAAIREDFGSAGAVSAESKKKK